MLYELGCVLTQELKSYRGKKLLGPLCPFFLKFHTDVRFNLKTHFFCVLTDFGLLQDATLKTSFMSYQSLVTIIEIQPCNT